MKIAVTRGSGATPNFGNRPRHDSTARALAMQAELRELLKGLQTLMNGKYAD
ncbi:hypothetical protein [Paralcaligenes ginsengisoli]